MTSTPPATDLPDPRLVFAGPPQELKRTGDVIDFATLRRRREAGVPGEHFFVIAMFFHVPDPTIPVDDIKCDADNVVGVNPVRCMICDLRWTDEDQASGKPVPPCGAP